MDQIRSGQGSRAEFTKQLLQMGSCGSIWTGGDKEPGGDRAESGSQLGIVFVVATLVPRRPQRSPREPSRPFFLESLQEAEPTLLRCTDRYRHSSSVGRLLPVVLRPRPGDHDRHWSSAALLRNLVTTATDPACIRWMPTPLLPTTSLTSTIC